MPELLLEVLQGVEPSRLHQLVRRHRPDEDAIGDCWRTCIACILGLSRPDLIPHFVADGLDLSRADDVAAARRWLRSNEGLDLGFVKLDDATRLGVPAIGTVASKAGPWNHCVVVQHGAVIWCPSTGDGDHPGDYTASDLVEDAVEVICRPYEPGPDELLAEWKAEATP